MNEQTNTQLIEDLYAAFNRGDIPAVLSYLDPQAQLHFEGPASVPWAGNRSGVDGWTQFFQAVGANMENVAIDMQVFAAQGDRVVCTGRYSARVRSTGKFIDSPLVHLWTLRNGKVVLCHELTDTAAEAAACVGAASAAH
jgi:ketosteroid isomerase-like protein